MHGRTAVAAAGSSAGVRADGIGTAEPAAVVNRECTDMRTGNPAVPAGTQRLCDC